MRKSVIRVVTALVLAAILLMISCNTTATDVTVTSTAESNPNQNGQMQPGNAMPGTSGTVQEINSNTITVSTREGNTVSVVTSDNTTIQKTAIGELSDITIGDSITVSGETNTDGSIQATSISITPTTNMTNIPQGGTPGAMPTGIPPTDAGNQIGTTLPSAASGSRKGTMGTVQSISGSTITVSTVDGSTVNIVTSDSTIVQKTITGELSDITVGINVTISGETNTDGSINATSIFVTSGSATP